MPLPDLIEIVPLTHPVRAEITVPGSKSITNRALILAALANGKTTLQGALWSEDTQVMVECLCKLGFKVEIESDPNEFCNRIITVEGLGGKIPNAGTPERPLELFVGNAGTAARFLSALICLGEGIYRLSGVPRMHERPQAALFNALKELGYRVDSANNKLPAIIFGEGPKEGSCKVSIAESSQFASALLLISNSGKWKVEVTGENAEESPYVAMTSKLVDSFPQNGGTFEIEPDASGGSYFWAARIINDFLKPVSFLEYSDQFGVEVPTSLIGRVAVANWPGSGWQIDENFRQFVHFKDRLHGILKFKSIKSTDSGTLKAIRLVMDEASKLGISRLHDLGDSIMTAIVVAPLFDKEIKFNDLGRLRVQECERVFALKTELTKCGAKVVEEGDSLTVFPSQLHGAEIETYNDHRMAMCFAVLGLKVSGIKLRNPACVKKTFPNFFQKLAAKPPAGLGATILDAKTGQPLSGEQLFAD